MILCHFSFRNVKFTSDGLVLNVYGANIPPTSADTALRSFPERDDDDIYQRRAGLRISHYQLILQHFTLMAIDRRI